MKNAFIKIIFLTVLSFYVVNHLYALEHPRDSTRIYKINYWVTGIIDVGGTVANVLSINRIYNKPEVSEAEFSTLNKNSFNKFDRLAFKVNPAKRVRTEWDGTYVLAGTIALPLLLNIDKKIRKNWSDILLMYYEMHMVTFGIYNYSFMGPTFQDKYRPVVYYDQLPFSQRKSGKFKSSFYSGHVASSAASTFFMVKVYSDYHPELRWRKYLLYGAAMVPPLVLSYMRVLSLSHFPSDNMVGLGLGMLVGVIVPELHKIRKHGVSLGMFSSDQGTGLSLIWNPEYRNAGRGLN